MLLSAKLQLESEQYEEAEYTIALASLFALERMTDDALSGLAQRFGKDLGQARNVLTRLFGLRSSSVSCRVNRIEAPPKMANHSCSLDPCRPSPLFSKWNVACQSIQRYTPEPREAVLLGLRCKLTIAFALLTSALI